MTNNKYVAVNAISYFMSLPTTSREDRRHARVSMNTAIEHGDNLSGQPRDETKNWGQAVAVVESNSQRLIFMRLPKESGVFRNSLTP